jgi:hypothetical protein
LFRHVFDRLQRAFVRPSGHHIRRFDQLMRDLKRTRAWAASLSSAVFILSAGSVPATSLAADHLDAPSIAQHGEQDITDVYAFSTQGGSKSVFIIGVNPGAGALPTSGTTFGHKVTYKLKVDTNADLRPDVTYSWKFGMPNGSGQQVYTLRSNGTVIANGVTGNTTAVAGGGLVTAGLYDDPFFFDLQAFRGAVLGNGNGRSFCDGNEEDFFLGLNISALILRVPNSWIGGDDEDIGVWATTEMKKGGTWVQRDMMARPAINTVFNNVDPDHKTDKELFNRTQPAEQVELGYRDHVADVLTALGGDPALADVLIADVLTYHTGDTSGFLNGRRLRNDVIDAELGLVTGGAITTDCIGNDSAFPGGWPYLAPAN